MTATAVTNAEAAAVSVTAYEQLRGRVLAGTPVAGDVRALGVLVREGIAAWIERHTAGAATPAMATRCEEMPRAAADLRASLVRVLATMAMSVGEERSRR